MSLITETLSHIASLICMYLKLFLFSAWSEISTRPLAQESVKTSWTSANCRFYGAFLKVTRPMASAVKITFPTLFSVMLEKYN